MTEPQRHFDANYRERVTLRDGSEVTIRLVRPEDKAILVKGHERLSESSRYLRFFTSKNRLSGPELAYLTELDQDDHFALGALNEAADRPEGLGVARFVRDRIDRSVADPAIAVVDAWHGRGLGRLLLMRLIAAARERGITVFRAEVLAENKAMLQLLHDLAPNGVTEHPVGDGTVIVQLMLPEMHATEPQHSKHWHGPLYRVLSLTAEGLIAVANALHRVRGPHTRTADEQARRPSGSE